MRNAWRLVLGLLLIFGTMFPSGSALADTDQHILDVIRQHPDVILESLQDYQRKRALLQQQNHDRLMMDIGRNPNAFIGSSPQLGALSAPVTLIEFSDFQCPYCARAHDTVQKFLGQHPGQVRFVFKNYPLGFHPEAARAASAAWAAGQQGKFWPFYDRLFAEQKQLGETLYTTIAQDLKLDLEQFNRDRQSREAAAQIAADVALADRLGLEGTPFFVLNGQPLEGAIEISDLEAKATKFLGS